MATQLRWRGAQVKDKLLRAAKDGIDETTAESVTEAKRIVPVDTSTLQGSIRFDPAQIGRNKVVGEWGSFDVDYAIYVELGTYKMRAQPYLRPTADREYPKLKGRIARRFRG